MATDREPNPTAVAYAKPLLELATEQNQAAEVGKDLEQIAELIRQNPSFGQYLFDPGVGNEDRKQTLARLFGGRVSPLLHNFIGVLSARNNLRHLVDVAAAYDDLLEAQLGNVEVDVTSAQPLSPEQLEQVRSRVGRALGKNAVVHQYVDESLIGGLTVRVQDKLIDTSVRYQLQAMKERLLAAAPR